MTNPAEIAAGQWWKNPAPLETRVDVTDNGVLFWAKRPRRWWQVWMPKTFWRVEAHYIAVRAHLKGQTDE